MKILSFSIGIIFAYFIIKIFVNFKKHGYNSTDIKTSLTDFIISFEKHLTEEIEFYKLEIENVIMEN